MKVVDTVIQIEITLSYLNDLFAKSVAFKDEKSINKLNALRHSIYYGDFNYQDIIEELSGISKYLKKYE